MKATITLQELAIKLNGKFWSKEGKERVFLDKGYNTKKMSTKTYVEVRNDEFVVRCFIDCPSQNDNWIESQQEEIVYNVSKEIREVLATEYFYVINSKGNVVDEINNEKELSDLYVDGGLFLSEILAKINMKREDFEGEIKSISREDFEKLESEEIQKVENNQKGFSTRLKAETPMPETKSFELGIGKKVSHARFGLGEIIEEIENDGMKKFRILFQTEGEKLLLERFANLTFL